MKKLTAKEIDTLNCMRNSLKEEEENLAHALTRYFAMAKVVKEAGESFQCKELQEIGEISMNSAKCADTYITFATQQTEAWERVRELVRFKWSDDEI